MDDGNRSLQRRDAETRLISVFMLRLDSSRLMLPIINTWNQARIDQYTRLGNLDRIQISLRGTSEEDL